jgi:hypothetical protein
MLFQYWVLEEGSGEDGEGGARGQRRKEAE